MTQLIPIPFLIVTVTLLIRARLESIDHQVFLFKPLSTLLVILVAMLSLTSPGVQPAYTVLVAVGLVLSLGGDVALMFKSSRAFVTGLVLFLLAHVVYAITFTLYNGFQPQDLITGLALLIISVAVYLYLQPGLGPLKVPVIVYILVISLMVNRATSTVFGNVFSATQAWLISLGAILFWLSDLVLAINRFRRPFRMEALGLYLYYGGQLLIALSPSYFL